MGRGTPGAPGLSQDARNRILHLALPSHHSWLHREETEAQKGAGVAQVCSPLLCHMRTSQGQQQSLLCSEAARWRPSDAPWWNFLLERPGQFLPSPGIPSPGTTLPWGPPSEGPLSQGTPLPQSPFWPSCPAVSGVFLTPLSVTLALEERQTASSSLAFRLGPQFIFGGPLVVVPPSSLQACCPVPLGVPGSSPQSSPWRVWRLWLWLGTPQASRAVWSVWGF